MNLLSPVQALLRDEKGATAVEYGLIVAMIVIAMMVSLKAVASETIAMWDYVEEQVVQEP